MSVSIVDNDMEHIICSTGDIFPPEIPLSESISVHMMEEDCPDVLIENNLKNSPKFSGKEQMILTRSLCRHIFNHS